MFEWVIEYYNIILVTGPQRSGTTICAKMVAQDSGLPYIDEIEFNATDLVLFGDIVSTRTRAVIQCPSMCRYVHWWGMREDLAVFMMRRDIDEILRSEQRIQWDGSFELARYRIMDGRPSEVKYSYWDEYQKSLIRHPYDIQYRSLETHPLWVDDCSRIGWDVRQTEPRINEQV